MMEILIHPDPRLRVKCKSIEKVTDEYRELAKKMYETMLAADGLGIAANQVGLDIRLIVLKDDDKPLYMFNPVPAKSEGKQINFEGCLSYPGVSRKLKRAREITVRYRDINNKVSYRVLTGMMAVAFAHEFDHIQGVLFEDHEEAI